MQAKQRKEMLQKMRNTSEEPGEANDVRSDVQVCKIAQHSWLLSLGLCTWAQGLISGRAAQLLATTRHMADACVFDTVRRKSGQRTACSSCSARQKSSSTSCPPSQPRRRRRPRGAFIGRPIREGAGGSLGPRSRSYADTPVSCHRPCTPHPPCPRAVRNVLWCAGRRGAAAPPAGRAPSTTRTRSCCRTRRTGGSARATACRWGGSL